MPNVFLEFLAREGRFDEETLALLAPLARERRFDRGALLLRAGRPVTSFYFVGRGAVRLHALEDGEDVTVWFFPEGTFAGDFGALYDGTEAELFLEAIEPTDVVELRRAELLALARRSRPIADLLRVIAERAFGQLNTRVRLLHRESLETRYHWLLDNLPDMIERVPQYHLASWLGIKPESLSRLKRRLGG